MTPEQFTAMMPYICADLVGAIAQKKNIPESEALAQLYASRLYAALEQEDTKLWQYSTEMLYALFDQELRTGQLTFPDV